jgi:ABC-type nitrate/sulfonate/bicarbonate transport system substrate-binding protein
VVRGRGARRIARVDGATPAGAAEKVKMSVFQANLCCFPVYVAQHMKLFEKHGVEVELVYGTGIQVTNISSRPTVPGG